MSELEAKRDILYMKEWILEYKWDFLTTEQRESKKSPFASSVGNRKTFGKRPEISVFLTKAVEIYEIKAMDTKKKITDDQSSAIENVKKRIREMGDEIENCKRKKTN